MHHAHFLPVQFFRYLNLVATVLRNLEFVASTVGANSPRNFTELRAALHEYLFDRAVEFGCYVPQQTYADLDDAFLAIDPTPATA